MPMADPAFEPARDSFHHAKAVLIIPSLVKGGFIFGAEGGNGVMISRAAKGKWGSPAFYGLGSASFGLQAGLESLDLEPDEPTPFRCGTCRHRR